MRSLDKPLANQSLSSLQASSLYRGLSNFPEQMTRLDLITKIDSAWERLKKEDDISELVLKEIQDYLDCFDTYIGTDHEEISSERNSQIEELLSDSRKYRCDEDLMDCCKFLRAALKKRVAANPPKRNDYWITSCLEKPFQGGCVRGSDGAGTLIPDWVIRIAESKKNGSRVTKNEPSGS